MHYLRDEIPIKINGMNTGQMLITIGAMTLLGLMLLRVNNNFLNTNTVLMENKFGVVAVSLATSIMEEAKSKAFDAKTDTNSVTYTTELTPASSLGPAGYESYPDFNDFDDFNGLNIQTAGDTTFASAVFDISCEVYYVQPTSPDVKYNDRTWHKKLIVTVTSQSMHDISTATQDTLQLSTIFSYWYYR